MSRTVFCGGLAAVLVSLALQAPAAAGPAGPLADFVSQVLDANPEVQAAQAAVQTAEAQLRGAGLPLYNPDLELESEVAEGRGAADQLYMAGFSQTVDWHDKRSIRTKTANAELAAVRGQVDTLRLQKAAELLRALAEFRSAKEIQALTKQRREILERFARLAKRRHAAGDIPLVELDLARLSLADAAMTLARSEADAIAAAQGIYSVAAVDAAAAPPLPKEPPPPPQPGAVADGLEQIATRHPSVRAALLRSQTAMLRIRAAERERKADPGFSLLAGTDDGEGKLTFGFSVPLQLRNNRRFEVDIARGEAAAAEQEALQAIRSVQARLRAAARRYQVVSSAWEVWRVHGERTLEQRIKLLERLWRAGELSTTDYLVQVQQTLDTRISGATLRGELWTNAIEWLAASGHLFDWLEQRN